MFWTPIQSIRLFFFPESKELSGLAISAKPSIKSLQNPTIPKNDLKAVTETGTGSR
uniref:Uncharacterized protein n=1 Tax=Anguilla anguilla TaxID=7936 RepID=A0A0E9SRQ9_ANGAN